MSCECMKTIADHIITNQPFRGLTVTSARFDQILAIGDDLSETANRPVLEIELTCEGRKLPVRKSIAYTFCPFCGVAYQKLKDEEVPNGDEKTF